MWALSASSLLSVAILKEKSIDLWVNASFDFQVWEEDYGGLFSWLWTCGVAPAGGFGSGPWRGGTLWNTVTAGWCAPAHQAGVRLPRQSALLPLHYITQGSKSTFYFFTKGKCYFSSEKNDIFGQQEDQYWPLKSTCTHTENCVCTAMLCPHTVLYSTMQYCPAQHHSRHTWLWFWVRSCATDLNLSNCKGIMHCVELFLKGISSVSSYFCSSTFNISLIRLIADVWNCGNIAATVN